jgi:hypothetical protein
LFKVILITLLTAMMAVKEKDAEQQDKTCGCNAAG